MRCLPKLKKLLSPKLTKYIPHTPTVKQAAFLWLNVNDAFYGGAVGGGKSDALLMAALQYVDIPGYHALLLRDTLKNLTEPGALSFRANEWLAGTDAKWRGNDKRWEFPSGASLSFGYLDDPRAHLNYKSSEFQFVGIDEIVDVRQHQAIYMFSRLRKISKDAYIATLAHSNKYRGLKEEQLQNLADQYQNIPLRFRSASNPPEHEQISKGAWVKVRYVDPKTREKNVIFIPAGMDDNPFLNKEEYKKSLAHLDPITRRQLEDGDWEIRAKGELFDRVWFEIVDAAPRDGQVISYWDFAATEKKKGGPPSKDPAFTANCRMTVKDGIFYIERIIRFQKRPRHVEMMVRQVADLDGTSVPICIEQEPGSGGVNTIDNYRRRIIPEFTLREFKKVTSKYSEAMPFSSQAEAGNVKLVKGHWNKEFLDELELFPNGPFKDQVDAATGAFRALAKPKIARIRTL